MPSPWKLQWNHAGSVASRTFTPDNPSIADNYRRITRISRRCGQYCYTGGGWNDVTLDGYDELIDARDQSLILRSPSQSCEVNGDRPFSADSYMTTVFAEITPADSRRILAAWRAGALEIRRTLWVEAYDSRRHGQPYFRSEYADEIEIEGLDAAYQPQIALTAFDASDSDRLYADSWPEPPFTFALETAVSEPEFWENPAALFRRLEIRCRNRTRDDEPMSTAAVETASLDPVWNPGPADFAFERISGFQRGCSYDVEFRLSAGENRDNLSEIATISAEIDMASVPLHLSRYGNGVAVGKFSQAGDDPAETLFECRYPALFLGGVRGYARDGETGALWVDGSPILRRVFTGSCESGNQLIGRFDAAPRAVLAFYGSFHAQNGRFYPISFTDSESLSYSISPVIDEENALRLYVGSRYGGGDYVLAVEYIP